jgi:ABC-type ATPase with predicted acetyltransferase domain
MLNNSKRKDAEAKLAEVRSHVAWIVETYGPEMRSLKHDEPYNKAQMGRFICAEDVLRIIDSAEPREGRNDEPSA